MRFSASCHEPEAMHGQERLVIEPRYPVCVGTLRPRRSAYGGGCCERLLLKRCRNHREFGERMRTEEPVTSIRRKRRLIYVTHNAVVSKVEKTRRFFQQWSSGYDDSYRV